MLQFVIVASMHIQNKTAGLLGNVNGIKVDDFIKRDTGYTIPVTSNEETIYHQFGQTCMQHIYTIYYLCLFDTIVRTVLRGWGVFGGLDTKRINRD